MTPPNRPQRPVQVLVFGHRLSAATKAWLRETYGPFRIYGELAHVTQMCDAVAEAKRVLKAVQAQGADFSGHTLTLFARPGLGILGDTLLAAITGALGELPVTLNPMRLPTGGFGLSPELPVVDLQGVKVNARQWLREEIPLAEVVA